MWEEEREARERERVEKTEGVECRRIEEESNFFLTEVSRFILLLSYSLHFLCCLTLLAQN